MFTRIHSNSQKASPLRRSLVPDAFYSNKTWTDGIHSSFSFTIQELPNLLIIYYCEPKLCAFEYIPPHSFDMQFSEPYATVMPRLLALGIFFPLLTAVIGSPVRWSVRHALAIHSIDYPAALEPRNLSKRQCIPSGKKKPKFNCDGKPVSMQEFSDHIAQNGYASGRVTMFYTKLGEISGFSFRCHLI